MKKCLSIAGFDGSGGAGIQADLKTFSAFGCYGMTVLTALPIQNTCGVRKCYEIPLSAIEEQIEAIFDDIIPDSIKIGMLFNSKIVDLVANFLRERAKGIPIVLDPVMIAKSGDPLLLPEAIDSLKIKLIPLSSIITPNIPEAQVLMSSNSTDQQVIAQELIKLGSSSVLLKGGHLGGATSNDLYLDQDGNIKLLEAMRIDTKNTHGTGCTLSAAISACLALGKDLPTSCKIAKDYLYNAIESAKDLAIGKGNGPVNHLCDIGEIS